MVLKHITASEDSGKTVKYILKARLMLSERLVKKLKYSSKILCNSIPVRVNEYVNEGDIIEAHIDFIEESPDITPQDIGIEIIFEDDCMIAVNKQPNIVVHPTCSHPDGTVANAVMYHMLKNGEFNKIRPVSRLDRDTSGVIIFAKNQFVQEALIRQMNSNGFKKEYLGVVHGTVNKTSGTINLPIERKPGSIMLRQVSPTGDISVTHYNVLEYLEGATYLKFILETGRTHQIRVHCQAIGHPLIGDTLYSDIITQMINRQALHSYKASFTHPLTNNEMVLTAPVPDDINSLLKILRQ
jgi:23S rRNA pseudouridine1911/1915/1917 synthase